jgi:hypothetical protein
MSHYHPGAPGLDSETWENAIAGCPTLDAFLFLRLGWETTNPTRHPIAGAAQ